MNPKTVFVGANLFAHKLIGHANKFAPTNPYLTKYIERMGAGIGDMIERCTAHGLREPEFKLTDGFVTTIWRKPELAFSHVGGETGEVTGEVRRLLAVKSGAMKRAEIQSALGLKHEEHFRDAYLLPALAAKVIEMTQPDSPRSPTQKYRLTKKGKQIAKSGTP